jgi:hypothetical protein
VLVGVCLPFTGCSNKQQPLQIGYADIDELAKHHPFWIQADRMQAKQGVSVSLAPMLRKEIGKPISMPDSLAADAASGNATPRPRPTFNKPAFDRVDEYSRNAQKRNARIVSREQKAISKGLQGEIARLNESMQAVLAQFVDRLGKFDKTLVDLQLREIALLSIINAHEGRVKTEAERELVTTREEIAARQLELKVALTSERNDVVQHFSDRREVLEADANRKVALRAGELQAELTSVLNDLRKQIASSLQPALTPVPPTEAEVQRDRTPIPAGIAAVTVPARKDANLTGAATNSRLIEEWREFARKDTEARTKRIAAEQHWQLAAGRGNIGRNRTEDVRIVLIEQWRLAFAGARSPYK